MKAALLFDCFGPYHVARLNAASRLCEVLAIQVRRKSREYAWEPCNPPSDCASVTLESPSDTARTECVEWVPRLNRYLSEFSPDCVFVPGWSSRFALAALSWSLCHRAPAVLMSESTAADSTRQPMKEWLKGVVVGAFSAALVGGASQAKYVRGLGMSADRVFVGYDAVDNQYFSLQAGLARRRDETLRAELGLPEQYFLGSARFVRSKNLAYLIKEYATYREGFSPEGSPGQGGRSSLPWSLVILGDGPERGDLESLVSALALDQFVLFPGFKQYSELPYYYANANAFVHASTSEPWGLVVNEAMASSLGVLVSERCGCVSDLVRIGQNGFTFDPARPGALSRLMLRMSSSQTETKRLGKAGFALISRWGPERFAYGLLGAAHKAVSVGACTKIERRFFVHCLLNR
jgi:1,2-diacylglycerol 3-alpha-glucosyltransferase